MYDFHTHTFLSDGVLAPVELITTGAPHRLPSHRRNGPRRRR